MLIDPVFISKGGDSTSPPPPILVFALVSIFISLDVGPVKPLKHSASDERIPSYSKPYLESGSFTLNKPRPRGANPDSIRGTQGPPLSFRGSQVTPNPNANIPKPLPRTVHSFAKSQVRNLQYANSLKIICLKIIHKSSIHYFFSLIRSKCNNFR